MSQNAMLVRLTIDRPIASPGLGVLLIANPRTFFIGRISSDDTRSSVGVERK